MFSKINFKKFNTKKTNNYLILFAKIFYIFCLALAIMIILFNFMYMQATVLDVSMQPTLNKLGGNKSDVVYLCKNKNNYDIGDIIVINNTNNKIIKRVVGLPGDIISIRFNGNNYCLWRNGKFIVETYINNYADMQVSYTNLYNLYLKKCNNLTDKNIIKVIENSNEYYNYIVEENCVFVMGDNRGKSIDSTSKGAYLNSNVLGKVEFIRYYGTNHYLYLIEKFIKLDF